MTSKTFRELQELLWLAQYVPKKQLSLQPEDDDIEVSGGSIDVDERAGERTNSKEPAPPTEETSTEVEGNQVQTSVEGEEDETPGVMDAQSAYRQSIEGRHEIAKPYSPLEIARTFRHMVIHSLVESDELLDVEETVHHSAQMKAIIPIFQDELYSDASLILLQDETDSMAPFQNLSIEFARIAEMYADFYTVRHARPSQESLAQLSIQIPNPYKCFVLVISDGLSNIFVDGQILELLSKYFPTGCKVIWVHPWERRYWPSEIHSLSSGRPSSWKGEATSSDDEDEPWMDS